MSKRGRKPQDKEVVQELFNLKFPLVKELMELGYPRYIACKKLRICRHWLYNNSNNEQRRILDEISFSFSNGKYQKDL